MARHRDADWNIPEAPLMWDQVAVAVLMDIRDRLNPLKCGDFLAIPGILRRIEANTSKAKRKRRFVCAECKKRKSAK